MSEKIRNRMSLWLTAVVAAALTMEVAGAAEKSPQERIPAANALQTLGGVWRLAVDPENKGAANIGSSRSGPRPRKPRCPASSSRFFRAITAWPGIGTRSAAVSPVRRETACSSVSAQSIMLPTFGSTANRPARSRAEKRRSSSNVTDSIREGDNLLAVRVLNPTGDSIDGYVLGQTPHRNKTAPPRPGSGFNSGGILYPVNLRSVPPTYVTDVFARPDAKTGNIGVTVTVLNTGGAAVSGSLVLTLAPASGGETLTSVQQRTSFPAGLSEHNLVLQVAGPRLWDLDDPYLYRVAAALTTAANRPHQKSVRCGFRDFRVSDGYFHLNGKRLFLKSTHTGNHIPIGQAVAVVGDFGRRDMIYAKASGFNTVRFISGMAYPEQLDFCDELGLMVYEECYAGWCLENSAKMGERYDRNTAAMIRRDRNHPCVTIWGLLNETSDGPVFRQAVNFLPKLRQLDPTRLTLLSSGRWDGQWSIGSASNPGSGTWEHVWGVEGPDRGKASLGGGGYAGRTGDAHYYPATPQTPQSDRFIRELGREGKPVFLSEYGIGSLMNVIDEWRHFQQVGAGPTWKMQPSSASRARPSPRIGNASASTTFTPSRKTCCARASACTPDSDPSASTAFAPTPSSAAIT